MTQKTKTRIAVAVAISTVVFFFMFSNQVPLPGIAAPAQTTGQLIVQDEAIGTGDAAQIGDLLTVSYTGQLQDGTVFVTSAGGQPAQFILGGGQVIPGWDQGLLGMKVGGKRLLVVPPDLAYGEDGYGPVPQNATLIYEVTLISVTRPSGTQ